MKRLFFVPLTAGLFAASLGMAVAASSTTTTTTTFSPEQGTVIREHFTTKQYRSFSDPSVQTRVGVVLPSTVELYPLPETIKIPSAETYSYSVVNNRPVVVERTTRKVIHSWE